MTGGAQGFVFFLTQTSLLVRLTLAALGLHLPELAPVSEAPGPQRGGLEGEAGRPPVLLK